ncbi:MAG TPA: DUF1501 domain-containing protein [Pyrinomonadaceae bacterium]|jgi:uncharacterized protein (DUF1501 family)
MDRRFFLKSSGVALASVGAMGGVPSFLRRAVLAQGIGNGRRKVLIAIFQRGAVDGLSMVVPHGEGAYYGLRPTLQIARPKGAGATVGEAAIDLDGFFGLHPSLASLKPLWDTKRLAIVHAVGSPDSTRSHFDAQDYMESATPGRKGTPDGWLNRYLQTKPEPKASPFRAVSLTTNMPRALYGPAPAVAVSNLADFSIRAGAYSQKVQGGFEAIYEERARDALGGTGRETFEAVNFLKRVNPAQYKPENGAQYPRTPFGNSLLQIAQMIKAGVGLEVAFTNVEGWDTHLNQRARLSNLLREFGAGLGALATDLGARMDDVVILTMSEFGRTARENGSRGTDHGHANAMFVIGNSVRGGKVYGDWPGLDAADLHEGRDLALTTDFRDVFGELAQKHLGNSNLKSLFPGYNASAAKFRGMI